jgi:hypothetical protein
MGFHESITSPKSLFSPGAINKDIMAELNVKLPGG